MSAGHAHRPTVAVVEEVVAMNDSSSRPDHENCSKVGLIVKQINSSVPPIYISVAVDTVFGTKQVSPIKFIGFQN